MASTTPITGAPLRAPGKLADISAPAPSRRAMLGLAAGAVVVALPISTQAQMPTPAHDSTAWEAAWKTYRVADEQCAKFYATHITPLSGQHPHNPCWIPVQVGTSRDNGEPLMKCFWPTDLEDEGWHPYQHNRGWLKARDRYRAYCIERDAFEARTGYSELEARGDVLTTVAGDTRDAMLLTPAPHLAALLQKLSVMFSENERPDLNDWTELRNAIRQDVARLG